MKRKIRRLTEQIHNSRIHYDRILGRGDKQLMTEQTTTTFKVAAKECGYTGYNIPNQIINANFIGTSGPNVWDVIEKTSNGTKWVVHHVFGTVPNAGYSFTLGASCPGGGQTPIAGRPIFYTTSGCIDGGTNNMSQSGPFASGRHVQINDGGTLRDPLVGDVILYNNGNFINNGMCTAAANDCTVKVTSVYPPCGFTSTPYDPCYNAGPTSVKPLVGTFPNGCSSQSSPASFDCDPNTLTCSDPGTGNGQYPTMADCTTNCSCDTSTASPCAVQWWQNPNATWASTWINNRDCSNYTWPALNLETQALALMASAPNPQPGPYNNWNDIWSSANAGWPNTTGGPKGQFIGKMAKSKFSQCQKQACNC